MLRCVIPVAEESMTLTFFFFFSFLCLYLHTRKGRRCCTYILSLTRTIIVIHPKQRFTL